MSLTQQLRSPNSPYRTWLKQVWDQDRALSICDATNQLLSRQPILRQVSRDRALIGTAFDYAFRWFVAPANGTALVAHIGMVMLSERWPAIRDIYSDLIRLGNDSRDNFEWIARSCVILAWLERIARGNYEPAALNYKHTRLEQVLKVVPSDAMLDLIMLMRTIEPVWTTELTQTFIMNPSFAGSNDVGGADADWVSAKTLYECKCVGGSQPFTGNYLFQAIGYALLDYEDKYRITHVAWYFVRHQTRVRMEFYNLVSELFPGHTVATLRQSLRAWLAKNPSTPTPISSIKLRYIKN